MDKKIIKIPSVDYNKLEDTQDILLALGRVANNYRFRLKDPEGLLDKLMSKYQNDVSQAASEVNNRLDIWKKLLFKYYKMHAVNENGTFTYEHTSYIYPYRVIDANNTLWVLEVKDGDDYNGGVQDHNYTVDIDWNYDVYLEEITEEEFRECATNATKHVIDRRLKRLSEPKQEYNIILKDELD